MAKQPAPVNSTLCFLFLSPKFLVLNPEIFPTLPSPTFSVASESRFLQGMHHLRTLWGGDCTDFSLRGNSTFGTSVLEPWLQHLLGWQCRLQGHSFKPWLAAGSAWANPSHHSHGLKHLMEHISPWFSFSLDVCLCFSFSLYFCFPFLSPFPNSPSFCILNKQILN